MRRPLALVVLLVLAVPSTAWALRRTPGDGTVSVQQADGYVALLIRGTVLGKASGRVDIVDPKDDDCSAELVWGVKGTPQEREQGTRLVCSYFGENLRFRLVGGLQWVRASGDDISISAVGRGFVWLRSAKDSSRGTYSFDGEKPSSLPALLTRYRLGVLSLSGGSG